MTPVRETHTTAPMSRVIRFLAALAMTLAGGLGIALTISAPAFAAADQIDSLTITYTMSPDGVLHAKERFVWRFGSSSGRHGMIRQLIVREPYGSTAQDAVYGVSNISVATEAGVSNEFSSSTAKSEKGRLEALSIKIGDPDRTVDTPTATYTISYDVTGAMRTFPGENPPYDEFFWDATGFANPLIKQASITASVPGGAQDASCFFGPPQSKTTCAHPFTKGGTATFTQDNIPAGQGVSIGVKITPGLVSDNKPHLERDGSKLSDAEIFGIAALAGTGVLSAIIAPISGVVYYRRRGRDQRYAGLAPGTSPLPGQTAAIVPNDPDLPIPVAFSPPRIPVAEAGLLIDGQGDARETAATIIDLAVRGALTVQSESKDDFQVTLVDPSKAAAPHEMVLLNSLFGGQPPGAVKDLSTQGSMSAAHDAMQAEVRSQVEARGWFRQIPKAKASRNFGFGSIVAVGVLGFAFSKLLFLLLIPLLPIAITVAVVRRKMKRGQRTAEGRAITDQVEGFKTYLATAEANQLRFEEGEDIFSRYLPWAIAFELADRWAKICGDLVAMGRLPNETPYWYYGNYNMAAFNTGFLTSSLTSAATPMPVASSSGTGFGGGSSFGGGGFSGGGGGGGGSSSW
jgi:uncharacterized membrane protein YgcG